MTRGCGQGEPTYSGTVLKIANSHMYDILHGLPGSNVKLSKSMPPSVLTAALYG